MNVPGIKKAKIEASGLSCMALINSMERGRESRVKIALDNGVDVEKQDWVDVQTWLNVLKDIHSQIGEMNMFLIGKAVIDSAEFPVMEGLEDALRSLDVAYHMNHRLDGESMFNPKTGVMKEGLGHYTLTEFNESDCFAVMVCDNPYPSKFDEGLITQLVRKFKPKGPLEKITLDASKETRKDGGESCTFLIEW